MLKISAILNPEPVSKRRRLCWEDHNDSVPNLSTPRLSPIESGAPVERCPEEACIGMLPGICRTTQQMLRNIDLDHRGSPHLQIDSKLAAGSETTVQTYHHQYGIIGTIEAAVVIPLIKRDLVRIQVVAALPIRIPKRRVSQSNTAYFHVALNLFCAMDVVEVCGNFLSENSAFLQHPEYPEPGYQYMNPQLYWQDVTSPVVTQCVEKGGVKLPSIDSNEIAVTEPINGEFFNVFHGTNSGQVLCDMAQDPMILTELMSHQKQALYFLHKRERGLSVCHDTDQICDSNVRGGLLADSMGLGKSLSMVSLIVHTLKESREVRERVSGTMVSGTTLIVAPVSTLGSWEQQISSHVVSNGLTYLVYHGRRRPPDPQTLAQYDVILTTSSVVYEESKTDKTPLRKITFFRIIVDEAHEIRAETSKRFQALCSLSSERRWAVSGTPIQNKVEDLAALFHFIGYKPLASVAAFQRRIMMNDIGDDEITGLDRVRSVLSKLCLRRTKECVKLSSQRREVVIDLPFRSDEQRIYDEAEGGRGERVVNALTRLLRLRMLCDHAEYLHPKTWTLQDANLKVRCLICQQKCTDFEGVGCPHKPYCTECIELAPENHQAECLQCTLSEETSPEEVEDDIRGTTAIFQGTKPSTKIESLIQYIRRDTEEGGSEPPKHVVFSVWTRMLDLIASALDEAGIRYCRFDGKMSRVSRDRALSNFAKKPDVLVILMSLKACGVGINLTCASRAHLMEPHWNPMVELQALDRIHRLGQTRDVLIRRYVIEGTIETDMLRLQRKKMEIARQSLDSGHVQADKFNIMEELVAEMKAKGL